MQSLAAVALAATMVFVCAESQAQDRPFYMPPPTLEEGQGNCPPRFGNSPFDPPECSDQVFVVDRAPGLDTGCTFRSGGPLLFDIDIDRVVTMSGVPIQTLLAAGLVEPTATLSMPAFDVDFNGPPPPERDRVSFNGRVVPGEFLQGDDGIWRLNAFDIPIEWINFPQDPGVGGTPTPASNTIRIDIDVLSSTNRWCTSIDWAALEIRTARPIVMVHGILPDGGTWNDPNFSWTRELLAVGWPHDNGLNMGDLDSIQSNAGKIAARVAGVRTRFGVDSVWLACHSKGGLDSRHYAESASDIAAIFQIGTPNEGSPLADVVQAGLLLGTGGVNTALINILAGPAGYQLTRPYMLAYNFFRGSNSEVTYYALAGQYDPECFFLDPTCRPVQRFLLGVTGTGDTIVPVSSVHGLPYTSNLLLASTHPATDAVHALIVAPGPTAQTNSSAIFGIATRTLQASSASAGDGSGSTGMSAPGPILLSSSGRVADGATESFAFALEADRRTFALVLTNGSIPGLQLVRPDGTRIDPTSAASDPDVGFSTGTLLDSGYAAYELLRPAGGTWGARVTGRDPTGNATDYVFSVVGEASSTSLQVLNDPTEIVPIGSTLTIRASLLDGASPVLGASVEAAVVAPSSARTMISMRDDGTLPDEIADDGIYTGALSPTTEAGLHRISATARAGFVQRSAFGLAGVTDGNPTIVGVSAERARDTNGNTLFDELVLSVDMALPPGAEYRLLGTLVDSAGNEIPEAVDFTAAGGRETVDLVFEGRTIFANGVDGPYSLTDVRLASSVDADLIGAGELTDPYETRPYLASQFERDAIRLTGNGTSTGRDTNANGAFDFLDVDLEIEVDTPGRFDWTARLVDRFGTEIDFVASTGTFVAGINTMRFSFDGSEIGRNGVAGPWFVRELLVVSSALSLVEPRAFTTDFFEASGFEGFRGTPPAFTGSSPCTTPVTATVNQPVRFRIEAGDVDPADIVSLTAMNLPRGSRVLQPLPATGNPVAVDFEWIPDSSQTGAFTVDFMAVDIAGQLTRCSPRIEVGSAPNNPPFVIDLPNNGVFDATVGTPLRFVLQFDSGDPGQGFRSIAIDGPPLRNLDCGPPSLGQIGRIECQFTPTQSQVGTQTVSFLAVDDDPVSPLSVRVTLRFRVAECYLLIGLDRADVPILGGLRILVAPLELFAVTMEDIPTFPIPPDASGLQIFSQVIMRNAEVFPTRPLQWTERLETTIGGAWTVAGPANGMNIRQVGSAAPGTRFTIAFTIDGI